MDYNNDHSIFEELLEVHHHLDAKYDQYKKASADEARAKKMEAYLRAFKAMGNQHDDKITPQFQTELEAQAMQDLAEKVGKSLKIGKYSLFRNEHKWYLNSSQRWGADDVFEAELEKLLQIAGREATGTKTIKMGVGLVGGQSGNINQAGLDAFVDIVQDISKDSLQTMTENAQQAVNKAAKKSRLITAPTFRSGKVDVTGYSADWVIGAEIKPEWEDFIKTFTGASFSVKNYSSRSQNEVIHIGNSNPYKAIYSVLSDDLGYGAQESAHIYYHTVNFYAGPGAGKDIVGSHIVHLRFAYELTGNGLYDSEGNRIDGADFFIYNDPASNNIWVRSTKKMIAEIQDYIGAVNNPLDSGIVLLKQSFA